MNLTSSPTASEMSFIFWIPILLGFFLDLWYPKKPGQPQFSTTSSNLQVTVSSKMDIQELSEFGEESAGIWTLVDDIYS